MSAKETNIPGHIIDSSVDKAKKPDADIFTLAEKRAGFSGQEILFVENSPKHVQAATDFGWQTFLYDSARPEDYSKKLLEYFHKRVNQDPSLTPQEKKTIDWYDSQAMIWAQKHGLADPGKSKMFDREMKTLFDLLPSGKILEIGTGHGGDAMELIAHYGLQNYVGIDAAAALLEIAKSRNPGARFELMNVYDLGFPDQKFDGFWISAMLIHVHKAKLQIALREIHRVTKDRGLGFISVMEGEANMEESRPGRHYSLWSQTEFENELLQVGFMVIHKRKIATGESPWMTFLVRKEGSS